MEVFYAEGKFFEAAYASLTWNLICRTDNTACITLKHMGSDADAITVLFNVSKTNQEGDEFEQKQVNFPGNLCGTCINSTANSASCPKRCPFNSGVAPPEMDDRSDAKGPEPECVTTGIMSDTGKRLAFVGVERTGGIYVYDVSTPAQSRFQDYLNVRNWRSGETTTVAHADLLCRRG